MIRSTRFIRPTGGGEFVRGLRITNGRAVTEATIRTNTVRNDFHNVKVDGRRSVLVKGSRRAAERVAVIEATDPRFQQRFQQRSDA